MAIILENFSKCPLCGKVLDDSKEYLLIPPLTSNIKDPLFIFSDNGVHVDCLNKSPLKEKLLYHIDMYDKRLPPSKSRCTVDGQLITNPKNLISFGMLTSNAEESLSKFNYLILNRENIAKWDHKDEFISIAEKFIRDGKWEGLTDFNYINYLINEIGNTSSK